MKNVAIVGIVGIPACYGGFESLVENITRRASEDVKYTVFCSDSAYEEKISYHNGAELVYIPIKANGAQSIIYDIFCLVYCLFSRPSSVLILGVSGCLFLPVFKFFSCSKIIVNIDGLEWKRNKWGRFAKWLLKISEAFAIKYADEIVTDNEAITDYVESEYGYSSKTIAYGGDHAVAPGCDVSQEDSDIFDLGLCRIEPENNVQLILEAYSKNGLPLKFVGNWSSSEFGSQLKMKYSTFGNIELLDPIYEHSELFKLRKRCSLYLHGHSAGGTNPSLVEMMHFGKPVFAFDCEFNRFSTENSALYFTTVKDLTDLIASTTVVRKEEIGISMLEIANERYTWDIISSNYEALYQ